jgi:hypothetical protein
MSLYFDVVIKGQFDRGRQAKVQPVVVPIITPNDLLS